MASLSDLATVIVKPQETMRRVLAEPDRWTIQIVVLAFVAASVQDSDANSISVALPGLGFSVIAIVAMGLVVGAAAWVGMLFLLAWIAGFAGKKLGGTATYRDVRAALAWGLVPIVWSPLYRIPFVLIALRFHVTEVGNAGNVFMRFLGGGGCSIVVVYLTFQLLFAIWSIWVGSYCLAEAQNFSPAMGFANLAITLGVPVVIVAAAVIASHFPPG
jgi:hypothetical protein